MPSLALVSKTSLDQRDEIQSILGPSWDLLSCHEDRDRLCSEGSSVQVVYGNVRPFEFSQLPSLKFVQATWAGIDNLLYPEMVNSDVVIANVRGAHATVMSEHVIAGLLHFTRSLHLHHGCKEWKGERRSWPMEKLSGSSVCLFGAGAIAKALIPRLMALGCSVHAINRSGEEVPGATTTLPMERWQESVSLCQHLILLAPSTPACEGLIDEGFLGALQPGGVLVNVSRGKLVVEQDLLKTLDSEHLKGALLDVTAPEPPLQDSPLFTHPKVLLTGHCAASGGSPDISPFEVFRHNLRCWVQDQRQDMQCVVDKVEGY